METPFLAFTIKLLPRIGPLKDVDFTLPSSTTEELYITSVNKTVDSYDAQLTSLQHGTRPTLPNLDFDTGRPTTPGEYALADETYAKLVDKLTARHYDLMTADLRSNILSFYSSPLSMQFDNSSPERTRKLISEVNDLKDCAACRQ